MTREELEKLHSLLLKYQTDYSSEIAGSTAEDLDNVIYHVGFDKDHYAKL